LSKHAVSGGLSHLVWRAGSITALGGNSAKAIEVDENGTMELDGVETEASGDGVVSYGIVTNCENQTLTMRGGSVAALGAASNATALLAMGTGTSIKADNTSFFGSKAGVGLSHGSVDIFGGRIEAASVTVSQSLDAVVTVAHSRLIGGPTSGAVTCVLVSRGSAVSSGTTCP